MTLRSIHKNTLFFCFALLSLTPIFSQNVPVIKFKRDGALLMFFQKGAKSDTILKGKNDLFYLMVPDSLKGMVTLDIENGRLTPTSNDSIVRLEYLKGLRYESSYLRQPDENSTLSKSRTEKLVFKPQINGASEFPEERIKLRIVFKGKENEAFERVFWYPARP